jgi:hypothetical protein
MGGLDDTLVFDNVITTELGRHITSSPLFPNDYGDFSSLSNFFEPGFADTLEKILFMTSHVIQQLLQRSQQEEEPASQGTSAVGLDLDGMVSSLASNNTSPARLVQTCALASRITIRTFQQLISFDDVKNQSDLRLLYNNLRYINLTSWAGLPYVYLWMYVPPILSLSDVF